MKCFLSGFLLLWTIGVDSVFNFYVRFYCVCIDHCLTSFSVSRRDLPRACFPGKRRASLLKGPLCGPGTGVPKGNGSKVSPLAARRVLCNTGALPTLPAGEGSGQRRMRLLGKTNSVGLSLKMESLAPGSGAKNALSKKAP